MRQSDLKSLIKEIFLKETPESVFIKTDEGGRFLSYDGPHHVGTFMVIELDNTNVYFLIKPNVARVYCSEKKYEAKLNQNINDPKFLYRKEISSIVSDPYHFKIAVLVYWTLNDVATFPPNFSEDRHAGIAGRIFRYKNQYYCSFWQKKEKIKPLQSLLKKMFNEVYNISLNAVLFEPADYWNSLLTAEEIFGSIESTKGPTTDDLTIQQKRELHLNPQLKKKVLSLPPQKLKRVADKIGMPMAQFRQYMGMAAAEEE